GCMCRLQRAKPLPPLRYQACISRRLGGKLAVLVLPILSMYACVFFRSAGRKKTHKKKRSVALPKTYDLTSCLSHAHQNILFVTQPSVAYHQIGVVLAP